MISLPTISIIAIVCIAVMGIGTLMLVAACARLEEKLHPGRKDKEQIEWIRKYREHIEKNR